MAIVSFAMIPPVANAGDRLILSRDDRENGSSIVKLGTSLPVPWETKFGVDLGLGGAPAHAQSLTHSWRSDTPASTAWGSLAIPGPDAVWAWDRVSLDARINPENEKLRVGGNITRRIAIAGDLSAELRAGYAITQDAGADVPQSWETSRSVRLNVPVTGTSFIAKNRFASADADWHTALGAEQQVFGAMKLESTLTDIQTDEPTARVMLRMSRSW